jgi:hypothetical protein
VKRELRTCGCGAKPGELHSDQGCDIEPCPLCGRQQMTCPCIYEVNGIAYATLEQTHPAIYHAGPTAPMYDRYDAAVEQSGGRMPWTGEYPGTAECVEFGWFSRWVQGRGWVPCDADHPDAGPNLNRLGPGEVTWDRALRRWVRP